MAVAVACSAALSFEKRVMLGSAWHCNGKLSDPGENWNLGRRKNDIQFFFILTI